MTNDMNPLGLNPDAPQMQVPHPRYCDRTAEYQGTILNTSADLKQARARDTLRRGAAKGLIRKTQPRPSSMHPDRVGCPFRLPEVAGGLQICYDQIGTSPSSAPK